MVEPPALQNTSEFEHDPVAAGGVPTLPASTFERNFPITAFVILLFMVGVFCALAHCASVFVVPSAYAIVIVGSGIALASLLAGR